MYSLMWYNNIVLQCSDSIVSSGSSSLDLLTVQSSVGEVLERQWYSRYIASLTVEEKAEEEMGESDQNQIKKAPICIEHTVNKLPLLLYYTQHTVKLHVHVHVLYIG